MLLATDQYHPIMCLTQDGLALSHVEQVTELCAAGAGWIQLRMKNADTAVWLSTARAVAAICREHGATFIVNDSVEIAVQSGADGVHLGKLDLDWSEARRRLGPDRILGGTVNHSVDAANARAAGCLDYVGVGPWRFTANKKNLAPVLGPEGVRELIAELGNIPGWVIGGIEATDVPAVRDTGAAGVAVSSALYRGSEVKANFERFAQGWPISPKVGALENPVDMKRRGGHGGAASSPCDRSESIKPVTLL